MALLRITCLSILCSPYFGSTFDFSDSAASLRSYADVICNQNEDCTINCSGDSSCAYTKILCPSNYACSLSCLDHYACKTSQLIANDVTLLSVECQSGYTSYSNAAPCHQLNVTSTGLSKTSSKAHISCTASTTSSFTTCYYPLFNLQNFDSISVSCNTESTCNGLALLSNDINSIDINCNDDGSCGYSQLYMNETKSISFNFPTNKYSVLSSSDVYIDVLYNKFNMECTNMSCSNIEWHFKNIYSNSIAFNCYDSKDSYQFSSCRSSEFYIDASYKFDLTCNDVYSCRNAHIYGDCSQATIYCTSQCQQDTYVGYDVSNCINTENTIVLETKTLTPAPQSNQSTSGSACDGSCVYIIFIILFMLCMMFGGGILKYLKKKKQNPKEIQVIQHTSSYPEQNQAPPQQTTQTHNTVTSTINYAQQQPQPLPEPQPDPQALVVAISDEYKSGEPEGIHGAVANIDDDDNYDNDDIELQEIGLDLKHLIGSAISWDLIEKSGFSSCSEINKALILALLKEIEPRGDCALNDAITRGVEKMLSLKMILKQFGVIGHQFIHIVLTGGADNASTNSLSEIQKMYYEIGKEIGDEYLKTFFIGIGLGMVEKVQLQSIATLAGDVAELYNCDDMEISDVFNRIKISLGIQKRVQLITDGVNIGIAETAEFVLQTERNKFLVLFDLDVSASMKGVRWIKLQIALAEFFDELDKSDMIGCVLFNDEGLCITGEGLNNAAA